MNWYRRALSGLLAGAMGVSLLGTAPVAAAAETRGAGTVQDAEGEITVTLRLDYPMTVSGWKARAPKVTLKRNGAALLQAGLEKAQTLPDGGKGSVEIALRTEGEEVRSLPGRGRIPMRSLWREPVFAPIPPRSSPWTLTPKVWSWERETPPLRWVM